MRKTMTLCAGIVMLAIGTTQAIDGQWSEQDLQEAEAISREREVARVKRLLGAVNSIAEWPRDDKPLRDVMAAESQASVRLRLTVMQAVFDHAMRTPTNVAKRKELVQLLAERLNDDISIIRSSAARYLLSFRSSDFTEASRTIVRNRLDEDTSYGTIMLAGIVDIAYCVKRTRELLPTGKRDEEQEIEDSIDGETTYHRDVRAAMLVAARNGDKDVLQATLSYNKSRKDKVYRWVKGFDELSYILQPEVVAYLVLELDSEEVIAGGADTDAVSCAENACLALSKMLEGFPAPSKRFYSREDIERCRAWVRNQRGWVLRL